MVDRIPNGAALTLTGMHGATGDTEDRRTLIEMRHDPLPTEPHHPEEGDEMFSPEQFAELKAMLEPIAEANRLMLPMLQAQRAQFDAMTAPPAPSVTPAPETPPPSPPPAPPAETPPAPPTPPELAPGT